MSNPIKSILVIGSTGRTGKECLTQLTKHPSKPHVHAFCRNEDKLTKNEKENLCTSVVVGDARSTADIQRALDITNADWVVVCVGNGDDVSKTDIRTASAQATANALKDERFRHVRVIVVSSTGAGGSKIIVGMGVGKAISYHLRHVLTDHNGQEAAFMNDPILRHRTTVIRPTSLTDNHPTGKVVTFGDVDKPPTIKTDRADLVKWIINEMYSDPIEGRSVNITSVKNH